MDIKKSNEHLKKPHDLLDRMKASIAEVLAWKMSNLKHTKIEDDYLDEYSYILKVINSLNKKHLSPKDVEFLKIMELYYYIIAQKLTMDPWLYQKYLRNVRDNVWAFYLSSALGNGYTLKKNPLRISPSELFSISTFMDKQFIHQDWYLDWDDYLTWYEAWKPLKFIELLKDSKKNVPDFKKEHIDIPLLLKIFDLDNESSKNVFDHILYKELDYTQDEILAIHKKYTMY